MTRADARDILTRTGTAGIQFHALPSDKVEALRIEADLVKYRQPKNANGSRARYFHAFLCRLAARAE